ncbi:DUF6941 family protein [Pseudonocardia thermophila]|uniref:DUF6941 family protein n=1 Tax=Pseudonocardia thermophila TaxID=1848 RepID=UPI0009363B0A|nr:hypothetical protein [Pseudonocardia thermophila]
MKLIVLLADAAQAGPAGKVHALGLGWTVIDTPTSQPASVIVLVIFDRQADAVGTHEVTLRLLGDDGTPVTTPDTDEPILIRAGIEVGPQTAEEVQDMPSVASFIVNVGPGLPLEPGRRYRWEAEMEGERASFVFVTRPRPVAASSGAGDALGSASS